MISLPPEIPGQGERDRARYMGAAVRDFLFNRTCRLIAHSTSDFDDRLQFHKIDYFLSFLKNKIVSRNSLLIK